MAMNLAGMDIAKYPGLEAPGTTRHLQDKMRGSADTVTNWMLLCEKSKVVMYTPDYLQDIQKLMECWKRTIGRRRALKSITLVTAIKPVHCGKTMDEIREQIEHPIVDNKWSDVIGRNRVMIPPVPITTMRQGGPEVAMRTLVVTTLVDKPPDNQADVTWWASKIEILCKTTRLLVEVKRNESWYVKSIIEEAALPGVTRVDDPRPSKASTKDAKEGWHCIWVHVDEKEAANFNQRNNIMEWTLSQLAHFHVMAGWEDMVKNKDALIIEYDKPDALRSCRNLIRECMVLSSKKALITTHSNSDTWTETITEIWKADPLCCINRVASRGKNATRPRMHPLPPLDRS